MANRKITELNALTGANATDTDVFAIVDVSADETKKITLGEFKNALDTGSGFVRITGDTMTGDLTVPNLIVSGNVDGRDVSADGTKLDGIEAGADVTDTANVSAAGAAMETGAAFTGNITFGDNDKAIFGAGSDLQIYHDGSHSRITDAGTGNLRLRGSNVGIESNAGHDIFTGIEGGAVILYHNNSQVFTTVSTGIDVTGTVTADGLTVDGSSVVATFGNTASNNYAQIKRTTSNVSTLTLGTSSNLAQITGGPALSLSTGAADGTSEVRRMLISSGGDISFFEDTGTTPKFFWDASAESLGIGTSSPSSFTANASNLVVGSGSGTEGITINSGTSSYGVIYFADGASGSAAYAGNINYNHADNSMRLGTNGSTTDVVIDSSGSLLVGLSSPEAVGTNAGTQLRADGLVYAAATSDAHILSRRSSDGAILNFRKDTTTVGSIGTLGSRMSIGTGDVGLFFNDQTDQIQPINTSTNAPRDAAIDLGTTNRRFKDLYLSGGLRGDTIFKNNAGTTEYARFDSSGNLLVGTTQSPLTIVSGSTYEGMAYQAGDYLAIARSNGSPLQPNRLTSDGDIITLRKDGTTVGSIGTNSGRLAIGSGDTGVFFADDIDAIYPHNNLTARDGAVDLGVSGARFKDLYLSGGVYLGGTGAANKLDDYEEGTWTPVTSSGTISNAAGSYTKVGRLVTLIFRWSSITGGSGQVSISGLPFAKQTGAGFDPASGGCMFDGVSTTRGITPYIGGSNINFYGTASGNANIWWYLNHSDGTGTDPLECYGSIWYYTNS